MKNRSARIRVLITSVIESCMLIGAFHIYRRLIDSCRSLTDCVKILIIMQGVFLLVLLTPTIWRSNRK